MPLSQVRDLLGHASIVTTERYDNQQMERLQVARASWNRASSSGHRCRDQGQSFTFLSQPVRRARQWNPVPRIEDGRKLLRGQHVEEWLGGRDSNPDNVVQSHVSYR